MGIQVGEEYDLLYIGNQQHIPITIAGIWREADLSDFYWSSTTVLWDNALA